MPLIDDFLPAYDVRERHWTRVDATAEATWAAIREADLGAAPLARLMLAARALPAALARRAAGRLSRAAREPLSLAAFERHGFHVLAERAPHEIVIGLEGRFWTPDGGLRSLDAATFRTRPPAPGTARAAWDFTIRPAAGGGVELATETRVQCADRAARRRFLVYWAVVRPGSGIIRRFMLRAIRKSAERDGSVARR